MYSRILVAIDGSDTSELGLREAIDLGKDQNAVLLLVHVVDISEAYMTVDTPYPFAEYQKALQEAGEKLLARCITKARAAGAVVESKLIIIKTYGEYIYDAIEKQSREWMADLVVIGTHGRRGSQSLMLGSVAEGLIRVATKPVLLVRAPKQEA